MYKNAASQSLTIYVTDAAGVPLAGDDAALTAYESLDDAALTELDSSSTPAIVEIDATDAKGFYRAPLTQAETDANKILFTAKSATAGAIVLCMPPVVWTLPPNFSADVFTQAATAAGDIALLRSVMVFSAGTATAGSTTQITLQTALGADSLPSGCRIVLFGGAGLGQSRGYASYTNGSRIWVFDRALAVAAASGTVYAIVADNNAKLDANLKVQGVALVDLLTAYTGNTPQTGDSFARIGANGAGLTAADDAVIAAIAALNNLAAGAAMTLTGGAQTALLAAFWPGVTKITGAVVADGGNTTLTFKTNLAQTETNHFKDAFVTFTSGTLNGQTHRCTAYNGSTKFLTFTTAFSAAPTAADTFLIVNV